MTGALEPGQLLRAELHASLPASVTDASWDRERIERLLPHRAMALLLDRVIQLDVPGGVVVADYDLSNADALLQGHFPGNPVWPGTSQVEAIGQAGLLALCAQGAAPASGGALTDILTARFVKPIRPPGHVRVVARVMTDGLFHIVAGRCIFAGEICSAAVLRGIATGIEGGL